VSVPVSIVIIVVPIRATIKRVPRMAITIFGWRLTARAMVLKIWSIMKILPVVLVFTP